MCHFIPSAGPLLAVVPRQHPWLTRGTYWGYSVRHVRGISRILQGSTFRPEREQIREGGEKVPSRGKKGADSNITGGERVSGGGGGGRGGGTGGAPSSLRGSSEYDLVIGTSEHGQCNSVRSFRLPAFR